MNTNLVLNERPQSAHDYSPNDNQARKLPAETPALLNPQRARNRDKVAICTR